MSGHSKWSQIKHKKAITDSKRSKIFSKLVRVISVESKKSHGDVNAPGLRAAIEKARAENMPSDNIERAVKKGSTDTGAAMEPLTYEGYGPGGAALVIDTLTDNRNKTAQEIKHILSRNGCSLAEIGAAAWAFEKTNEGWVPKMTVPLSTDDLTILERVIDELEDNDDVQNVATNAEFPEEAASQT